MTKLHNFKFFSSSMCDTSRITQITHHRHTVLCCKGSNKSLSNKNNNIVTFAFFFHFFFSISRGMFFFCNRIQSFQSTETWYADPEVRYGGEWIYFIRKKRNDFTLHFQWFCHIPSNMIHACLCLCTINHMSFLFLFEWRFKFTFL